MQSLQYIATDMVRRFCVLSSAAAERSQRDDKELKRRHVAIYMRVVASVRDGYFISMCVCVAFLQIFYN